MLSMQLWNDFISQFSNEIKKISDRDLAQAWKSSGSRTALYEDRVLIGVAEGMNMTFKKEEFKVDYTFCKTGENEVNVPLVFVESENVATSAHHEIRKLCCLHAPLKVLIVCAEWSNEPGDWTHGGLKEKLLEEWRTQIRSHNKVWPSQSVTGVIVAEWNKDLKYYSIAFDHFDEVVDEHRVIIERTISQ